MISLNTARRLGITPETPGVVLDGFGSGIGSKQVRSWRVPIASIDIAGEKLSGATIVMEDIGDTFEMLVGIDFFLSHRIFVANSQHRMYFTYDGGPVFGVDVRHAVTANGAVIAQSDTGKEPVDAAGFSRRGTAYASKHDYVHANADLDKAIELAPGEAGYYIERAQIRLAQRRPQLAADDINRALELAPNDAAVRMTHAEMLLSRNDLKGATVDLQVAEANLAPPAINRLQLATLYDEMGNYEAAITTYSQWLHLHGEDAKRFAAYNGRCLARAQLNRDIDKAIDDCNQAWKLRPGSIAILDSRGLAYLRKGNYQSAIDDFSMAIANGATGAWPLYARGLAEKLAGQAEAGKKDVAAAMAINPNIRDRAVKLGLEAVAAN